MPVRGEKRGTRDSPLSTTTRTPSIVRLVSAMEVASTTLRSPGRRWRDRGVLRVRRQVAVERMQSHVAPGSDPSLEQLVRAPDLAGARQEGQHVAFVARERPRTARGDGPLHALSVRAVPTWRTLHRNELGPRW